jgi:hypothetical protein
MRLFVVEMGMGVDLHGQDACVGSWSVSHSWDDGLPDDVA